VFSATGNIALEDHFRAIGEEFYTLGFSTFRIILILSALRILETGESSQPNSSAQMRILLLPSPSATP